MDKTLVVGTIEITFCNGSMTEDLS